MGLQLSEAKGTFPLYLNLGCGYDIRPEWVNVDKDLHSGVDLLWDLENFPYPWDDDSVDRVLMNHVLEHLGASTDIYLHIWKELYRICKKDTLITIVVPHPRHDNFIGDPTHVRPVTPDQLQLFSKKNCREWKEQKVANTPLAEYINVDFEIVQCEGLFEDHWINQYLEKEISFDELQYAMRTYNNVVKQVHIVMKTIK